MLARLVVLAAILLSIACAQELSQVDDTIDGPQGDELAKVQREEHSFKLASFFNNLKQTPKQGASFFGRSISWLPFGKITLVGGILLGVFFVFLRLLVVVSFLESPGV